MRVVILLHGGVRVVHAVGRVGLGRGRGQGGDAEVEVRLYGVVVW